MCSTLWQGTVWTNVFILLKRTQTVIAGTCYVRSFRKSHPDERCYCVKSKLIFFKETEGKISPRQIPRPKELLIPTSSV